MSEVAAANVEAQPPQAQLIQMATAHWVSRLVHSAAQVGLADHLAGGPRRADEIARTTEADARSLYRVMRTLASLGLFTEAAECRFALTPLGAALRRDAPGSVRSSVLTLAGDVFTKSFDHLLHSIQTGKTGFEKAFGMPVFDWFAGHVEEATMFSETMIGLHGAEFAAVAAAYDFSGFDTVVDVGGATGNLLTAIFDRYPMLRGVLFDLPHVVADISAAIKARGHSDRISVEAGNFFDGVPAGADAYLLSHVIHDWSEQQCLAILDQCRRSMKPNSRLLIIEMVLASGSTPQQGKMLDMIMLVVAGGQERTEPEYRTLLNKAGFKLLRVVPTNSTVSVLEHFPLKTKRIQRDRGSWRIHRA